MFIDNKGKTALIFGVRNDRSIAFAIAQRLHQSGCRVALSYIPETKDDVLYLMEREGLNIELSAEVDVRSDEQVECFVKKITDHCGKIDYILHATAFGSHSVMCSSPMGSSEKPGSYLDIGFEDLMDSFNISAYSLIRICRISESHLSIGASILPLTYNASQRVFPGYAGMSISKAALENIVLYLAHHFGKSKVRVNALSPGFVMTTSAAGIKGVRKLRKIIQTNSPLGNISVEEIADSALYYFSDLSRKVTGNIHHVDGGINIMGVNEVE